jgi:hypothetical protein
LTTQRMRWKEKMNQSEAIGIQIGMTSDSSSMRY